MSKELEKLENLATLKCITDHEHIDRVLKYMLSLPFSYLQKDEVRYKYLRDDLSKGFHIYQDDMNQVIPILIRLMVKKGDSTGNLMQLEITMCLQFQ